MGFFFPSVVLEESGIGDGIDMDMSRRSIGGFVEVGVVASETTQQAHLAALGNPNIN